NMAVGHVMHSFPNDRMNEHQSEIDNYYRYLLGLELTVVILFTFINIVYYYSSERIKKASWGKNSLGLKIIDSSNGIYLTSKQALYRVGIFLIMMFCMIAIHWLVGLNYYVIVFCLKNIKPSPSEVRARRFCGCEVMVGVMAGDGGGSLLVV
ncbi:MAG: RDD family protein, partial [Bacteroidaceae bacterium]|nr:RDD family protein [Bacteroidaceae bacterium]